MTFSSSSNPFSASSLNGHSSNSSTSSFRALYGVRDPEFLSLRSSPGPFCQCPPIPFSPASLPLGMVTILFRSESEHDPSVQYVLHPDEIMLRVYNDYAKRIGYDVHNISIRRRLTHYPIMKKIVKNLILSTGGVYRRRPRGRHERKHLRKEVYSPSCL
ncbi:uncharacterized protein [Spinacia oleracea]|uniref:FAR1 domain-containing protein n=1 Tax=Spinacia oleracea TaxID=3562 RepID=A0ABM3R6X0_SPIOL|nr:uncharacterized protein LOC130466780 [Spinacia oleracea]